MTYDGDDARRAGLTNQTKARARRRCGTLWKIRACAEGLGRGTEGPRPNMPSSILNIILNILDGALLDHGVGHLEEGSDVRAILQILCIAVPDQCSLDT